MLVTVQSKYSIERKEGHNLILVFRLELRIWTQACRFKIYLIRDIWTLDFV